MPSPMSFERTYDPTDSTSSKRDIDAVSGSPQKSGDVHYEHDHSTLPPGSRGSSPLSSIATGPKSMSNSPARPATRPQSSAGEPPPKRRKLTFAERETLRIEKQFKDLQKAEEKASREAEKSQKEEQKRVENENKEEKRRIQEEEKERKRKLKEAEKVEKEENKRRREAEKAEKDESKRKKEAEKEESKRQKDAEKAKKDKVSHNT